MPSSQPTLKAKIAARDRLLAQKDSELVAQAAEILTMRMQIGAMENILAFQNGAFEAIAKVIEKGPHAYGEQEICTILERHLGRKVQWQAPASPWQ